MQVQQIAREQLVTSAREVAARPHPMKAEIGQSTEEFLSRLDRYEGANASEIRQDASIAAETAAVKKAWAKKVYWASFVPTLAGAGYIAFNNSLQGPLGVAILVGTAACFVTNLWSQREEGLQKWNEQDARSLVSTLDSWTAYLSQPPQGAASAA